MPLNDEEWRAFINEYDGVMRDVEEALAATLVRNRFDLEALRDRGEIPAGEALALIDTTREALIRVQARLNAYGRRLLQMREAGEL
jgi:hypothetical protein